MKNLSLATIVGLATLSSSLFAVESTSVTLDTLIIYSQGAETLYNGDVETRINYLVESTNKIYKDSGLNVTLNPVKIQQYQMDDTATSGTVLSDIRQDSEIQRIRDEVGADNVVIYRPYANDGACGLAYQNNYLNDPSATWVEAYAYAHISIDCGGYVTAHEVGHNTGLGHSSAQGSVGAYEYARGHGVQDNFTTIMAYETSYNGAKINKYSSPSLDCNGLPCGIEEGETNAADAVKALIQTLPLVENFREHIVVETNTTDTTTDTNTTDNSGEESNTTDPIVDDGDDNSDNNETIDDDAQRLADALKAYNDQLAKVDADREELSKLKEIVNDKKDTLKNIRIEYRKQRTAYKEIITEYRKLIKAYRVTIKDYRQARRDYRAKKITKEQFNTVIAKVYTAIDNYKAYYTDVLLPAYTVLKEFKEKTIQPAIDERKEAYTNYRAFYNDVYRADVATLIELKNAYLALT
jgi:hypothetical protein